MLRLRAKSALAEIQIIVNTVNIILEIDFFLFFVCKTFNVRIFRTMHIIAYFGRYVNILCDMCSDETYVG